MTVNLMNISGKMLRHPISIKREFDRIFQKDEHVIDLDNMTEEDRDMLRKVLS